MEEAIRQLVQLVHDDPHRVMMVVAGAGTRALSDLLGVAGATRTLLEALVPYSQAAFDSFLGQTPEQYVADTTARLLAGRAFTRARWLRTEQYPVLGLACTATIVTDRPKRGEHRAHIGVWQVDRLTQYSLYLKKGARERTGEENLVSRVMLNTLSQACNLNMQLALPLVKGDELKTKIYDFAQVARKLYLDEITHFCIEPDGQLHTDVIPQAVLSGSFNPLHDGHLELARAAADILKLPVIFECAARNVDKPPLPPEVVLDRLSQFAGCHSILASNAPTFLEKARLYPGTVFVVGYDTAERILHPRYYQDSQENLLAALAEIQTLGCRFIVAGRVDENDVFRDVNDLHIPAAFTHLFQAIPESRFRKDISSTELRQSGERGSR